MTRLRFATAQEVFAAFPTAREDICAAPSDEPPLVFLKTLLHSPTPEDAIGFCAYVLPRREAVWWACQSVRTLDPSPPAEEAAGLRAGEAWAREPEEHRRLSAAQIGMQGNRRSAGALVALAAAWSGGLVSVDGNSLPAPPAMTAKMARAAILIALARIGIKERAAKLRACVEGALALMGDDMGSRSPM